MGKRLACTCFKMCFFPGVMVLMVGSRDELLVMPGEHQGDLGTDPGWVLVQAGPKQCGCAGEEQQSSLGGRVPTGSPSCPRGHQPPAPTDPAPPLPHGPGTRQLLGQGDNRRRRGLATAIRPLAAVCLAALALNSLIPGEIFSARKGRAKLGGWERGRPLCCSGTAARGSAFGVAGESFRKDPRFGTQLRKRSIPGAPAGEAPAEFGAFGPILAPGTRLPQAAPEWGTPTSPGTPWAGCDPVCCEPVHPS